MLKTGIAAQEYSPKNHDRWTIENLRILNQLGKRDKVLAVYGTHRFLAYGTLASNFNKGKVKKSLKRETTLNFNERFDCVWSAIPFKGSPKPIKCDDLKARGFLVDQKRGYCVAPTNARTFREIERRINVQLKIASQAEDLESITGEEGRPIGRYGNYFERKSRLRSAAIEIHGEDCMVCGFNFGERYGKRGEGFIEVHHIRLISSHGKARWISPSKDMIVVCSNCHRMIHRRKEDVWTAAKLKRKLLNCTCNSV